MYESSADKKKVKETFLATSRQGYPPKKARLKKAFHFFTTEKKSFAAKIPSVLQVDQG